MHQAAVQIVSIDSVLAGTLPPPKEGARSLASTEYTQQFYSLSHQYYISINFSTIIRLFPLFQQAGTALSSHPSSLAPRVSSQQFSWK